MKVRSTSGDFVIGRDLGPAGRLVRILAGLLNLLAAAAIGSMSGPVTISAVERAAVAFVVVAAIYTAAVALVGPRLFGRLDPWLTALVLVVPLAVLFAVPGMPDPVTIGAFGFLVISQFVQAAIGYGGCEIVGIPTLLLRRRCTVYCAINGADAVEVWLKDRPAWIGWLLALGAFAVTMALGAAAEYVGSALGFFAAYLAFLVIGFGVSRLMAGRPRASGPDSASDREAAGGPA